MKIRYFPDIFSHRIGERASCQTFICRLLCIEIHAFDTDEAPIQCNSNSKRVEQGVVTIAKKDVLIRHHHSQNLHPPLRERNPPF